MGHVIRAQGVCRIITTLRWTIDLGRPVSGRCMDKERAKSYLYRKGGSASKYFRRVLGMERVSPPDAEEYVRCGHHQDKSHLLVEADADPSGQLTGALQYLRSLSLGFGRP